VVRRLVVDLRFAVAVEDFFLAEVDLDEALLAVLFLAGALEADLEGAGFLEEAVLDLEEAAAGLGGGFFFAV
jgi:hypothetical protein